MIRIAILKLWMRYWRKEFSKKKSILNNLQKNILGKIGETSLDEGCVITPLCEISFKTNFFQFQFIDLSRRIKFFTRRAIRKCIPSHALYIKRKDRRARRKGCEGRSSAKLLQGFTLIWSTVWEIVKTVRDEDGLKQGREGITKSRMRLRGFPVTAPCGKFSLTRFHPVFLNFHSYVFIIRKLWRLCAPLVNSWPGGGEEEDRGTERAKWSPLNRHKLTRIFASVPQIRYRGNEYYVNV